jgi:uncharacterized protein (DUF736 family)
MRLATLSVLANGAFTGSLVTLDRNFKRISIPLEIVPLANRTQKQPTHEVYVNGVKVGAVFPKTSETTGLSYGSFSISIPGHRLDTIYAAMFFNYANEDGEPLKSNEVDNDSILVGAVIDWSAPIPMAA